MNQDLIWALLLSWGAGIDLYLTVLLAGLVGRMQWLPLPSELSFLANDWTLVLAAALFLVEFVADKIPYIDSFWDAFHTFIRVPAGILLALGAAHGIPQHRMFLVALAAGLVSFGTHGAKASVRLALNSTPEPFTNWFVSFAEDGLVAIAYWLFLHHPWVLICLIAAAVVIAWLTIYLLLQFFKKLFRFLKPEELRQENWSPRPKRY